MADVERVKINPGTTYEHSDWHIGIVGLAFCGILVLLVIAPLVMIGAFPRSVADVSRALRVELPQPRLQTNPPEDLAQFRADEETKLHTYYWVDKQQGLVHIPIEEAMKKLARDGIDGFPQRQP
jgi:hypothetical protein